MKIKIQTRNVYGRMVHYPKCELSLVLANAGKVARPKGHVITDELLRELIRLGFLVEQVREEGDYVGGV